MIKSFYTSGMNSDKQLFDTLFFQELNLKEITNNDDIMTEFTEKIEECSSRKKGYTLFSIDIKTKHHVVLICKSEKYGENYNFCYIMSENKSIDAGTSFKVEEEKETDIHLFIQEHSKGYRGPDEHDIVSLMITKTMMGYRVNKSKAVEVLENIDKYTSANKVTTPSSFETISNFANLTIGSVKNSVTNRYHKLKDKFELPLSGVPETNFLVKDTLNESQRRQSYNYKPPVVIARIDEVYNINNKRIALFTSWDRAVNGASRFSITYTPGDASKELLYKTDNYRGYKTTASYDQSCLQAIEYNYIDKGRYVAILGDVSTYKRVVIFQDPMIKELSIDDIKSGLEEVIRDSMENKIDLRQCQIDAHDENGKDTVLKLSKYASDNDRVTLKEMQKGIKNLYNEYNYVVKKNKSEGDDVKVTDDLTYYHESGKIEYNDFAIELDAESIKQQMYEKCKKYMIDYFRKEITEDQILEQITEYIYDAIDNLVQNTATEFEFNIKFNNSVNVKIEVSKGGNKFTYINENRVNKNEISSILREVSCYRSQEAADKFIANICKKGLSVFIGLSSGYFHKEKFYKFKTSDTRGEYIMNIDGIDINVKGKKVFNTLFSIAFKDERSSNARVSDEEFINNHVFKSVTTKFDYIKYKIMIDKSYQIFINRSKAFLDKKVADTGASFVKYYDNNQGKIYDGVKVTGTSGRTYVIAYDLKESFVFMEPKEDSTDEFSGGNYICMIDQSKMKASVGYDTVVSKLLSLKNDSVIASTIYNLEDELNK